MFCHIAGSWALLTVFQAQKIQPKHETTVLVGLEGPNVKLLDSPLPVTQTVTNVSPAPPIKVKDIKMHTVEESQPLIPNVASPHLLNLPPPTEPVICSCDLPREQPPQWCPGGLAFVVNTVETPTTPLTGLIQFAPPMGVEDWEGKDPEDLYTPLWMDHQKIIRRWLMPRNYSTHFSNKITISSTLCTQSSSTPCFQCSISMHLDMKGKLSWKGASQMAATTVGCGQSHACRVRQWTLHWVTSNYDPQSLPLTNHGWFNTQALQDEDLSHWIQLHLPRAG